jgi:putative GTP pyrophosphokinase
MTREEIQKLYSRRYEDFLLPLEKDLQEHLVSCLMSYQRIDRISVRAKSIKRFVAKAMKETEGNRKYMDPLRDIQDQLGARVITFYESDVTLIAREVERYFRAVETRLLVPESDSEFGYFGKHYVLFIPEDILDDRTKDAISPFFELQIKTLFQHAWAEANHDLGYKPSSELSPEQRRKIAFTAAQAWGADKIFDELSKELN